MEPEAVHGPSPRGRYYWLVLVAAGLGAGLYTYALGPGLAGTGDSREYLAAAQSLRRSGQLLGTDGSPYRLWPPLFPVVLSWLGGTPGPVRWLNGAALLGTLGCWSAVGWQLLPRGRRWALPLLLACSSPMLVVSKFVWSEPLFSWLWAGYFLALLGWLRHGSWRWAGLATGLGLLLPLQRIAGGFLLAGVGLALLWLRPGQLVRPGRWALLAHFAGASSGLLLWQWHIWQGPGDNRLAQGIAPASLPAAASDYGFVLGRWLLPLPVPLFEALPAAAWALLLLALLAWLWPRRSVESSAGLATSWPSLWAGLLFGAVVASLVLLIVSGALGRSGRGLHEAERYATALYAPVVVLGLLAWPATPRWARCGGPVLLAAWLLYQGARAAHNAQQLRHLPLLREVKRIH